MKLNIGIYVGYRIDGWMLDGFPVTLDFLLRNIFKTQYINTYAAG